VREGGREGHTSFSENCTVRMRESSFHSRVMASSSRASAPSIVTYTLEEGRVGGWEGGKEGGREGW